MKVDFVKEVLEDPETFGNFKVTKYEQSKFDKPEEGIWYGQAEDRTGMTIVNWCTRGHGVTYFGEKLEDNISVGIGKDAGTRFAFNGYCHTKEDFKRILTLTW